ncbi:MAG: septation protein SpoVG family protein [Fibrobacterota bacterium]
MDPFNPIRITNVNMRPLAGEAGEKIKAYCDIILNNSFAVTGLKIVAGKKALYVKYPWRRGVRDGSYYPVFMPLSRTFSFLINDALIKRYLETVLFAALE